MENKAGMKRRSFIKSLICLLAGLPIIGYLFAEKEVRLQLPSISGTLRNYGFRYVGPVIADKSQIDKLKNDVMLVEQKFNLFENDKSMFGQWSGFSVYRKEGKEE